MVVDFWRWVARHRPDYPVTSDLDPRWWWIREFVGDQLFDATVQTRTSEWLGKYYADVVSRHIAEAERLRHG